jgi:hypothetical protein
VTKYSITHFTEEEFEEYKKIQENVYEKTVYEVIVEFDLKDNGFFTLLTAALSGDKAIDEIVKKCKNKEIVTYEIFGEKTELSIHFDTIKLENKTFWFKHLVKGVFKSFEFNKAHESYTIKVSGDLLSTTLEYVKRFSDEREKYPEKLHPIMTCEETSYLEWYKDMNYRFMKNKNL